MFSRRYKARVWFVLLITGIILVLLFLLFRSSALGIGGLGVLGLLFLIKLATDFMDIRTSRIVKKERRAVRGAKAEEKIGAMLESLGEDYLVLHDVRSSYGNIDHLVIGKESGVYLVETKAHGGRVTVETGHILVNGRTPEKDFIAQTLRNTYWLRDRLHEETGLKIWITPLIVFTNAFVVSATPVKGIRVINKKYLPQTIQKPNQKGKNLAVWNERDRISKALHAGPQRIVNSISSSPSVFATCLLNRWHIFCRNSNTSCLYFKNARIRRAPTGELRNGR